MLEWLEQHQLPCFYHQVLHIKCPVCGFQTALILLLKGDFIDSLKIYPALIPTLILMVLMVSWLIFRKPGWIFIKRVIQFDLTLVFTSYFLRLLF